MGNMSIGQLGDPSVIFRKKNRWLFKIPEISGEGVNALPPLKSSRPNISFKEIEIQSLNETIYYPGKPEFKTIPLSLYEVDCGNVQSPIVTWLETLYNAQDGEYKFIINGEGDDDNFKKDATLEMLDGCGNCIEQWMFENCWMQSIDWGTLDMAESGVTTIDIVLRFDRAFMIDCAPAA